MVSIGTAERVGGNIEISQGRIKFYLNGQLKIEGQLTENNLYELKLRRPLVPENNAVETDLKIWHERLGHPCLKRMRDIVNADQLSLVIPTDAKLFCEACIFGKSSKKPFKDRLPRDYLPG